MQYCPDAANLAELHGGGARKVQPAGQEVLVVDEHVIVQLRLQLLRMQQQLKA